MDDSERSYGYSEDLYHGKRAEKSYEYGAEDPSGVEGQELSPEEKAMRIEGNPAEEAVPDPNSPGYDHGRETASYGTVESFTWGDSDGDAEREPNRDRQDVASAPDEELAAKPTR
jgi:hypothetical protein